MSILDLAGLRLGGQLLNLVVMFPSVLLLAWLCASIAPGPGLKKWALCLPFWKVLQDLLAGLPEQAYVASRYAGERWDQGSFRMGLGLTAPSHLLDVVTKLGAQRDDTWYPLSAGDLVANALTVRGLGWLLWLLVALVLGLGLLRLGVRAARWYRSRTQERALELEAADLGHRHCGPWRVPLRCHPARNHTGIHGLLRPTIWLSPQLQQAPPAQREAAVAHEIAHLRAGDPWLFTCLHVLQDLLWFVPATGMCVRRVVGHAELAADAAAVRAGADPIALAEAIVGEGEDRLGSASTTLGAPSALRRVRRLAAPQPLGPSLSKPGMRARAVLALYLGLSLLLSTIWGYA